MKKLWAILLAVSLTFGVTSTAFAQNNTAVRDSGGTAQAEENEGELTYLGELNVPTLVATTKAGGLRLPQSYAYAGDFYGKQLALVSRTIYEGWVKHFRATEASGTGTNLVSVDLSRLTVPLTTGTVEAAGIDAFLAVLSDVPELMYWLDKTTGSQIYIRRQNGKIEEVVVLFTIVQDYQGEAAGTIAVEGKAVPYHYIQTKTSDKARAEAEADAILASVAGKTDYEKVREFNRRICLLTSYDYEALEPESLYDDSYQWIYALTGKPVVCEGYAKAFKYLCDKAGIACMLANGIAGTGQQAGLHMWNVVELDGYSYLVDCTNNDGTVVGEYSERLLAVGTKNAAYKKINYQPDHSGGQNFFLGELLSAEDYKVGVTPPAKEHSIVVINGKASPTRAKIGTVVTLTADVRKNDSFIGWDSRAGITPQDAKAMQTTFIMPDSAVTVEAIYKSSGGGSSGGGSSGGGSSGGGSSGGGSSGGVDDVQSSDGELVHVYDLTTVAAKMRAAVAEAVAVAKKAGQRTAKPLVILANAENITPELLKGVYDEAVRAAAGTGVTVMPIIACDTVVNGKTIARIYLNPERFAASGAKNVIVPTATLSHGELEAYFGKYFSNHVRVFHLAQAGRYGAPVELAVKLDLTDLNIKTLRFYTYNSTTRRYSLVPNSTYTIDANGFLSTTIAQGGYVLVTDRAMTEK